METTKILWSGLTGRTGFEAIKAAREMPDVDIVMGMTRRDMDGILAVNGEKFDGVDWLKYDLDMFGPHGLFHLVGRAAIDVIVDFSHPDVFDKVLELAICTGKPLISGTAGLSEKQMMALRCTTSHIPIFRGGNFRFKVKKFIDEAVKLAMTTSGPLTLYENFYKGKTLPSETSRVVQQRIFETTGKRIGVSSSARLGRKNLVCDWRIGDLHCRTVGFDELAHDVLEIAKVMAKKPAKGGEPYDLDELWDDLVSWAL